MFKGGQVTSKEELAMSGDQVIYEVVSPVGEYVGAAQPIAPRLPDLHGKTVGEVWNGMFRGDATFPILRELLKKRYPDIQFVPYTEFPTFLPMVNIDAAAMALKQTLSRYGCDAIISGVGG
jgi:hypothetical protein